MVLEKHNKQQHSIKQKKENTTLWARFSVRIPLWIVKPLQTLTMCYLFSAQALTEHD